MKCKPVYLLAALAIAGSGWAQSSASTGAQASASTDTKASASNKQASAQSSGSASAGGSAQAGNHSANLASGTTFEAVLSHPVDAHKNKAGDPVQARSSKNVKSDGQVVIPKGSKLLGHVTEAKARAKGQSESSLGIVFDRAVLKNGQEVPLNVAIQAVSAAQSQAALAGGDEPMIAPIGATGSAAGSGRAGGPGGLVGGATSTAAATAGGVTSAAGGAGRTVDGTVGAASSTTAGASGLGANGLLTSTSSGVIGLQGLALNSAASNATQGSVITSSARNVHLDSGTQFLLRAEKP